MVNVQSPTAEIRRGKKKKKERKEQDDKYADGDSSAVNCQVTK